MHENFESTIKGLLSPLLNVDIRLHYPLIANSFPLAFYYAKMLDCPATGKDIKKFIFQRDWNDKFIELQTLQEMPCHIFFDTMERAEFKSGNYDYKKIPFSRYFPRFIFTEYSSRIINFLEQSNKLKGQFDNPRDFGDHDLGQGKSLLYFDEVFDLNIISELGIKRIYVFTDTKDEANYIKKHVLDSICNFVEVIIKNSTVVPVDSSLNNKDTLKLYFFSAPYNMFFLKDQYNFIPFQFRPEN